MFLGIVVKMNLVYYIINMSIPDNQLYDPADDDCPDSHARLKKGAHEEREEVVGDQRMGGLKGILTSVANVPTGLFRSGMRDTKDKIKDGWWYVAEGAGIQPHSLNLQKLGTKEGLLLQPLFAEKNSEEHDL